MSIRSQEFIKFIIVGIINTCNYYAVYLFVHAYWEINYLASHITGFILSLIISFFLSSYFTFQVKPTVLKFIQFPVTQVINIIVSSIFIYVFVEYFVLGSTIAPIVSMIFTVPLTFFVTGKILRK
ncbi:GtrA family protein [Paraliobacillus sp. X-1268]|uniref:GtrA family protein n=1 Tax=Paraliobacillus sp. X-1268 TaxID=2213193 RepID=UPI000E3ECFFB|nr:GtrA family protein [Paraliobacillus sp. X-1268]